MPADRSVLARILDPIDEKVFFRDYWDQKPVVLSPRDRNRFDGLFDLSHLEEYLFVARPPAGDVGLVRNGEWPPLQMVLSLYAGQHYDAQTIYDGLGEGYSVVLNDAHYRWPALWRVVAEVEDCLLATAQTNVYITGPKSQGFAVHSDNHDVFVLQTFGTKQWVVHNRPDESAEKGNGASTQPSPLHLELKCGDVLYLPVGCPHSASTTAGHSVHVSLGVFPLTWQELAHRSVDAVAASDASWRRPVPLPSLGGDALPSVSDLEHRLRAGLSRLEDLSAVVTRRQRDLGATGHRKNPAPSGYAQSLDALDHLDVRSQIERRPGVGCYVTTDARSAYIIFLGQTIRAPKSAACALEFIKSNERFLVDQIDESLTPSSKVLLVRRLIREGLLQFPAEGLHHGRPHR